MEHIDYEFLKSVKGAFPIQTPVLELGSRHITNQGDMSARKVFSEGLSSQEYIGLDFIQGQGVDQVGDVRSLPYSDKSISTLIAMNLFEHVEEFWLAMAEIKRVLKDDGILIIGTPFCYEIHGCPDDYFRFTPSFYQKTFRSLNYQITTTIGNPLRPKMVYFVASKNKILADNFKQYENIFHGNFHRLYPPARKIISSLRSALSPNHFRQDIKHQYTYQIEKSF